MAGRHVPSLALCVCCGDVSQSRFILLIMAAAVWVIPAVILIGIAAILAGIGALVKHGQHERVWILGGILTLALTYFIGQLTLFSRPAYAMGDIPWILVIIGLLVIMAAGAAKAHKLIISTTIGYAFGFLLAVLFGHDYCIPTQGGCVYNNSWQVWLLSFLGFIGIGVLWEIASRVVIRIRANSLNNFRVGQLG